MATSSKKIHKVGVLLYTGADILDFSGPLEILANAQYNTDIENPEPVFKPITIASTPTIVAGRCMTVQAEITISTALANIDDFDILVVPGGNPSLIYDICKRATEEAKLIQAFNDSSTAGNNGEKIILSVCTGAGLLGALGVLKGLKATTHHLFLDALRSMDSSIEVVSSVTSEGKPNRYVDGGINQQGKRVITGGGVSCGLDAAFFVTELQAGREAAEFVARIMEYEWKRA